MQHFSKVIKHPVTIAVALLVIAIAGVVYAAAGPTHELVEIVAVAVTLCMIGGVVWLSLRISEKTNEELGQEVDSFNEKVAQAARRLGFTFRQAPPYQHPMFKRPIQAIGSATGSIGQIQVSIEGYSDDSDSPATQVCVTFHGSGSLRKPAEDCGFTPQKCGDGSQSYVSANATADDICALIQAFQVETSR